jgi:hypothetical protein
MWVKDANYYNGQIFEAYHHQMADGGAGLYPNQVVPGSDHDKFVDDEKKHMQEQNVQSLLINLTHQLEAARAEHNEPEVTRLSEWINQTRQGLK